MGLSPYEQFGDFTFRVAENQPAGTVVGDVEAVDRDAVPFNRVVYSLDPLSDHIFRVDPDTGRLVTRRPLDREETASYQAVVVASPPESDPDAADAGSSDVGSCAVDVVVDDVNDSRPRFHFPTAGDDTLVVRGDVGIGHVIGQVRASDRDAGLNARLVYWGWLEGRGCRGGRWAGRRSHGGWGGLGGVAIADGVRWEAGP